MLFLVCFFTTRGGSRLLAEFILLVVLPNHERRKTIPLSNHDSSVGLTVRVPKPPVSYPSPPPPPRSWSAPPSLRTLRTTANTISRQPNVYNVSRPLPSFPPCLLYEQQRQHHITTTECGSLTKRNRCSSVTSPPPRRSGACASER